MDAVSVLSPDIGLVAACNALNVNRANVYREQVRQRAPLVPPMPAFRPRPPLAFSDPERQAVLDVLYSERFADAAPATVYATLLDDGIYVGSVRTMYRLLEACGQSRERRRQSVHPGYVKPELLATRPKQVWSWDITKLRGPAKWTCFHLYVILDIFSRYVVGWMIAPRESSELAEQLIAETVAKHHIGPGAHSLCTPTAAPACAPNPSPPCCSTSTSPKPIAGRTCPTTIRIPKQTSRP